jgi:hypothetical protein
VGDAVEAGQVEDIPGQGRDDAIEAARGHGMQQPVEIAKARQGLARERRSLGFW